MGEYVATQQSMNMAPHCVYFKGSYGEWVDTYLPIYLSTSICVCIYLLSCLSMTLFTYSLIYFSCYLKGVGRRLSTYLPIYLSAFVLIYLATFSRTHLHFHLPTSLAVYLFSFPFDKTAWQRGGQIHACLQTCPSTSLLCSDSVLREFASCACQLIYFSRSR